MNLIELTKEQRNIIAEFIFSYQTDVLIKSDAIRLIETLFDLELIKNKGLLFERLENKPEGIAWGLMQLLKDSFSSEQTNSIMNEYYGK